MDPFDTPIRVHIEGALTNPSKTQEAFQLHTPWMEPQQCYWNGGGTVYEGCISGGWSIRAYLVVDLGRGHMSGPQPIGFEYGSADQVLVITAQPPAKWSEQTYEATLHTVLALAEVLAEDLGGTITRER